MPRIITGKAKGKKLEAPLGDSTRPTSDRIKEAVFSSIQFDTEDRVALDLFAGSGQMGLEAISRGARSCMFVDSERDVIELVKRNAQTVGFSSACRYLVSDWRNYIRKASSLGRDKFDLVFIDPPYSMECCAEAADRLAAGGLIIPGAILVLESGTEEIDMNDARLSGFETLKSTHYGKKTFLNIMIYRGR